MYTPTANCKRLVVGLSLVSRQQHSTQQSRRSRQSRRNRQSRQTPTFSPPSFDGSIERDEISTPKICMEAHREEGRVSRVPLSPTTTRHTRHHSSEEQEHIDTTRILLSSHDRHKQPPVCTCTKRSSSEPQPASWLQLGADGRVVMYTKT